MSVILKRAVLSEKSMDLAKSGMFTFLVNKEADKKSIAKAVEGRFSVNVLNVKTANFKDKTRSQRTRRGIFIVPGFKKAVITLKSGQKIPLFELEEQKVEEKPKEEVKEKKSLLKGTKVKIEKSHSATALRQSASQRREASRDKEEAK